MPNYLRNADDAYSDPELIAAKYQVGKNAYFEVSLALAEYAEGRGSGSGGSSGSTNPILIQASYGGGGIIHGSGCPEENQMIWVGDTGRDPLAIRVNEVLKSFKYYKLYNPLSRNFNEIEKAELLENIDTWWIETSYTKSKARVSSSHKIITNTQDAKGTFLFKKELGEELLCFDEYMVNNVKSCNIYIDTITDIKYAGRSNCVRFWLKDEYIYAIGDSSVSGILGHNRKEPLEDV
jgi:hypothetical protein